MTANFGILGQALFSPKKAFDSIRETTTMADGIVVYVILAIIAKILIAIPIISAFGVGSVGINIAMNLVISIVIGLVALVAIGWLSSVLAKAIFKGTGDMGKTVGLLGYANIVDLVMSVITMVLTFAGISLVTTAAAPASVTGLVGMAIVGLILAIVIFVWKLYVGGAAVGSANNISLFGGAVSYFIAALVVSLIVSAIVAAFIVSTAFSMGGFGGIMRL